MALDPTISTKINPPQPFDIGKWAGLSLMPLKAQEMQQGIAESQARIPGIQAQTEAQKIATEKAGIELTNIKTQAQAAKDAVELDEKGQPIVDPVTGAAKINVAKYQYGLMRANMADKAFEFQKASSMAQQEAAKATGTQFDMNNNVRNFLATSAKAAYDHTKGTEQEKQAAAEKAWTGLADLAVQGSQGQGQSPLDPEQFKYVPGREQTLYTAQINPQAQESLRVSQGSLAVSQAQQQLATKQFENSRLTNWTDDASQQAGSGSSQRARDIVFNTTGDRLPDTMSATEIYNNEKYKAALSAAGSGIAAQRGIAQSKINLFKSFDSTLDNAKTDLASQNLTPVNFLQNWASGKVKSTPSLAALAAQMQQMPAGLSLAQNWEAMKAVNAANIKTVEADLNTAGKGSNAIIPGSGKSPTAAPGTNVPNTPAKGTAPVITSKEEYDALKSGDWFSWNGKIAQKR